MSTKLLSNYTLLRYGVTLIPVLDVFKRAGGFKALQETSNVTAAQLAQKTGIGISYIEVILDVLLALGWVSKVNGEHDLQYTGSYSGNLIPENISELYSLGMSKHVNNKKWQDLSVWFSLSQADWSIDNQTIATLLDGVLFIALLKTIVKRSQRLAKQDQYELASLPLQFAENNRVATQLLEGLARKNWLMEHEDQWFFSPDEPAFLAFVESLFEAPPYLPVRVDQTLKSTNRQRKTKTKLLQVLSTIASGLASSDLSGTSTKRNHKLKNNIEKVAESDPIAIVGMACRFPGGSDSPKEFWEFLKKGESCVEPLSPGRINWPGFIDPQNSHQGINRACLVKNIANHDMAFFGISPKEAELMDPQQRLLLELSWEAFEDAGLKPSTYAGSDTGVYIGVCHPDYRELMAARAQSAEAYVGTGNIPCMLANRLSYFYNFKGPSFTVDTACSSALFAISQAVDAIATGQCKQALVGAVNLLLTPTSSMAYYQAGMLSRQTACIPFDDASDGYIRGEGAGMLLLKPLSQAKANNDNILGVIKGVAINHGGKSRSLTAPSALAQSQVVTQALLKSHSTADSINYIETHGTGTPVGDPIEIHGITRAFTRLAKQQKRKLAAQSCALGALKSNIGHLEAAAGMASTIKVLLAMKHRTLPPNHCLGEVNRRIDLEESPFYLVRQQQNWSLPSATKNKTLRAGISSFGFGGTNAHMILESTPLEYPKEPQAVKGPHIIVLSAKSEPQLKLYAQRYIDWINGGLGEATESLDIARLAKTLLIGREAMSHRLAMVVDSKEAILQSLRLYIDGDCNKLTFTHELKGDIDTDFPDLKQKLADRDFVALAQAWVNGADLTDCGLIDPKTKKIPSLPGYPFARQTYWVPWSEPENKPAQAQVVLHHLLHENISNLRRQAYRTVIDPAQSLVSEHQVKGNKILPGVAYLVIAQLAASNALGMDSVSCYNGSLSVLNTTWVKPLMLVDAAIVLETQLKAIDQQRFGIEFIDPDGVLYCHCEVAISHDSVDEVVNIDHYLSGSSFKQLNGEQCYQFYQELGMEYGSSYQNIEKLYATKEALLAKLQLIPELSSGAEVNEPLPVVLLDSALQSSIGLVVEDFDDLTSTARRAVMPFTLESMQVFAPCETEMWSIIRLDSVSDRNGLIQFDLQLCNSKGVVCASFKSISLKRLSEDNERPLHETESRVKLDSVVKLSGDEIMQALVEMIAEALKLERPAINPEQNFSEYGVDSIVIVSLTGQINQRWPCDVQPSLFYSHPNIIRLAEYISGKLPADVPPPALHEGADVEEAETRRILRRFISEALKLSVDDIDEHAIFSDYGVDSIIATHLTSCINQHWKLTVSTNIFFEFNTIALLSDYLSTLTCDTFAMERRSQSSAIFIEKGFPAQSEGDTRKSDISLASANDESYHAVVFQQPSTDSEIEVQKLKVPSLDENDVLVSVRAFSLNFGDLLCLKGVYPDMPAYPFTPGFELAGVVVAIGKSVQKFAVGDSIVGITGYALGGQGTLVKLDAQHVFKKPPALSFEDACSIPVVAITVLDAFSKARIKPGERVLIQTAAGGVGLAAIQLAQYYGAEIYVTAGSEDKLSYLKSLGIKYLINYQKQDFEQEISRMTGGHGVDVILNTLPGDALQKGLNSLSPGGRYIEIAMTALKSAHNIDLSVLDNNQAIFSVNLRKLILSQPESLQSYFEEMAELVTAGIISPQIDKVLSFEKISDAYQHLNQRKNIGKVVVSIPSNMQFKPSIGSHRTVGFDEKEGIAIIGVSGRFAESDNINQLWENLAQGRDMVKQVNRWDLSEYYRDEKSEYCQSGSFMDQIDQFDPLFFNISGVEARCMDPQQRIFLEESWRALEDAGYVGNHMQNKNCGVFIGCTEGDYHHLFDADKQQPAQAFWGNALSIIPSRIAYHLDLHGPAVSIDTACSSSLVAVHQACQSLWLGETDMAISGGVFIQSTPKLYRSAEAAQMLSHAGHCHAFGSKADGFVPGEGVGVVILKRLSDAQADGDHIHGVIRGTGIGQDGTTNGITAPSPSAQYKLLTRIYEQFRINPNDIQMLEAHGTGTSLGDPIEFEALDRSFSAHTDRRQYCALGTIKSNIGHLAPAAGIAGLIKVLLAMKHQEIPPTLHCEEVNPQIDISNSPFYLNNQLRPWPKPVGRGRMAAISSFGFSGTNAHVVVEEAPESQKVFNDKPAYLIALSASTETQLRILAKDLLELLQSESPDLGCLSYTLLLGRKHFNSRWTCVATDLQTLKVGLMDWLASNDNPTVGYAQLSKLGQAELKVLEKTTEQSLQACIQASSPIEYFNNLLELSKIYLQGSLANMILLFSGGGYRTLSLPTYPFAKHSYWVSTDSVSAVSLQHPMLAKYLPGSDGVQFYTEFDGTEWYLVDHQVNGQKVLSAAACLEMARAAITYSAEAANCKGQFIRLSNVVWHAPLIVENLTRVKIHVTVKEHEKIHFAILSDEKTPIAYCQGIGSTGEGHMGSVSRQFNFEQELSSRPEFELLNISDCYEVYSHCGVYYGPTHRIVDKLYLDRVSGSVIALLELPSSFVAQLSEYYLHPGLIDAALQCSIGFELDKRKIDHSAYLPYELNDLVLHQPISKQLWVKVTNNSTVKNQPHVQQFDLEVYNNDGQLCVSLTGLEARRSNMQAVDKTVLPPSVVEGEPEKPVLDTLLAPRWRKLGLGNEPQSGIGEKTALVVSDDKQIAEQVLKQCAQPLECKVSSLDTFEQLQSKLSQCKGLEHIVISFGRSGIGLDDGSLLDHQQRKTKFLFNLIKAALANGFGTRSLHWTVMTYTAVAVNGAEFIEPALATLHGLFGSLAKEYPNWVIHLLDVDDSWSAENVFNFPSVDNSNLLAYRDKQWYETELLPCRLSAGLPTSYRQGGTYVLIGGAGGIGEVLSEYLIKYYQAQVIWIGRSAQSDRVNQKIQRLASIGPAPIYIVADATDQKDMEKAYRQIKQSFDVINGIVHSAIVLEDKSFANMSWDVFNGALKAKTDVSIRIAEVFAQETLDFVLFFSSANAFMKSAGQSNYVAGCTFKDAFAQAWSQQLHCPAKVINWGYWGTTGIVANKVVEGHMATQGIASIEPDKAMAVLEQLLSSSVDQLVYLAVSRPLEMLGVNVSGHEYIQQAPCGEKFDITQLCKVFKEQGGLNPTPDDSQLQIETVLLPLLWHQIKVAGLVKQTKSKAKNKKIDAQCYEVSCEPRWQRWLQESLKVLSEQSFLRISKEGILLDKVRDQAELGWEDWELLVKTLGQDSDSRYWLTLVNEALIALPDIVGEKRLATEVLFPEASMALVEGVYKKDRIAQYFNESLAAVIAEYAELISQETSEGIRIIEVGAGTGSATEAVLKKLNSRSHLIKEYCYTDISKAFVLAAEKNFSAGAHYLTYDTLNIEQAIKSDSLHLGKYDLVIASNVLHATRDISITLKHAKQFLKKDGLLIVNEISKNTLMMHLTFGLLDGWWLAEDSALRMQGCPGLTEQGWQKSFRATGFSAVTTPFDSDHKYGYQIIVAQSDGLIETPGAAPLPVVNPGNHKATLTPASSAATEVERTLSEEHLNSPSEQAQFDFSAIRAKEELVALEQLLEYLRKVAASVLDIQYAEFDSADKQFGEMVFGNFGMDSLLASNMRNRLLKEAQADIPVQMLIGDQVQLIAEKLYQQLLLQDVVQPVSQQENEDFETFVF